MKAKYIAALAILAIAFCVFAMMPAEETDAASESYTEDVGAIPKGQPYTVTYTFGGSGYWNDTMKTAPSFSIRQNCTTSTVTYERTGSAYNWAWNISFTVTPTYSGNFRCVMSFTTSGGFLSGDDTYTLQVRGSGLYSYTIHYDANGGTGAPSDYPFTNASNTASVTLSSTIPSKTGSQFLGWSESMNATAADYSAGGTYTFSAGTTNLYAVWKDPTPTPRYSIYLRQTNTGDGTMTLIANGTTYTNTQEIRVYVDAGSTVKFSYTASSGKHFVRWGYTINGQYGYSSTSNPLNLTINGDMSITPFVENDVVSYYYYFVSDNPSYGSVSTSSIEITLDSTTVMAVDNVLYVGNYGGTVTATPAAADNTYTYTFIGWFDSNNNNLGSSLHTYSSTQTFTAKFTRVLKEYQVTFVADPNYGSFVPQDTVTASYNTPIYVNGATITINNIEITAVANASDGVYTYAFEEWNVDDGDMITQDMTITATFSRAEISHITHWSNNMMNGRVSFVFTWPSEETETHNMSMLFYDGVVNPDYSTTWTSTGYTLNLSLSYPTTNFSFDLQNNGTSVKTATITAGKWDKYELTIDAENGQVWMMPLKTFTSFMEYTTLDSQKTVLFDFSQYVSSAAVDVIDHEDTGTGDHVRFSVTNTDVFLNTYGIVMNNPAINVYNYFPQYEKVRVNFYAFAIYGNAFSINGAVFDVVNGQVTVQYVTDNMGNNILATLDPDATPESTKSRTLALNNISVTWDGTRCYLTFESDRFTVDVGPYSSGNELVSFTGIWYFTSTIYEPQTSYEKQLGEWKVLPDLDMNQMLLIFLGILALVGSVAWIKLGGGLIDAMVMVFAGITAFILLV